MVYHGQCTHHFYENLHDLTDGEQLDLKTGDICIIPPNTCHSISVFDDSIIINLLIRTKLMKETLSRILSSNHLLFDFFVHTLYNKDTSDFMLFSTDADQRILNLLVDMMLEACERRPYYQQASDLMLWLNVYLPAAGFFGPYPLFPKCSHRNRPYPADSSVHASALQPKCGRNCRTFPFEYSLPKPPVQKAYPPYSH